MNKRLVRKMVAAVGVAAALCPGAIWAQQKHPISISGEGAKGGFVQQLAIDVDDVPGHQVRVFEYHRSFPGDNLTTVDGEQIVEWWGRGVSNYVGGIGPVFGYITLVTDKGNKIFLEAHGSSETQATETGSKRGTYHGTSRFVGGTGRFSKIRGYLVEVNKFDTDPKTGYSVGENGGEYWFEQ